MSAPRTLRIGTRASQLARWQADWVAMRLRQIGHRVEIIEITTSGDTHQAGPVADIGAPGVFTKEIQRAVLDGAADLAVHSLKDLPTDPVAGLTLAAVPPRESPADVLVVAGSGPGDRAPRQGAGSGKQVAGDSMLRAPCSLLPSAARVGTGSLRRQAQLRHVRPDLEISSIRGNVDTRLRKLDAGEFDAIVLAEAGLKRLGLGSRATCVLPFNVMLPAVGQGALGIECRDDDAITADILRLLDDAPTHAAVLAERSLLAQLRGGCLAPIGALGQVESKRLLLSAAVLSPNGAQRLAAQDSATPAEAAELGRRVADVLLAQGAAELIAAARA